MNDNLPVLKTCVSNREESRNVSEDWACGEPLMPQHLVLDFTPSEEADTDYVQKKCCAFWDLVRKSPELRNLVVLPELIQYNRPDGASSMSLESDSSKSSTGSGELSNERTALSMLEYAEEKGVVSDSFVPRLPAACSGGSREYRENEPTAATYGALTVATSEQTRASRCAKIRKSKLKAVPSSTQEVKHLCKTMQEWDFAHPKCMDPPGRVPYQPHCLMQRKVIR